MDDGERPVCCGLPMLRAELFGLVFVYRCARQPDLHARLFERPALGQLVTEDQLHWEP
jgi:hypothetical protein